ncbi:MAG: hypothetical protein V9E93_06285 [Steroidobacteraceae bacterium]
MAGSCGQSSNENVMGTMHQARSGTPSRFAGSNRQLAHRIERRLVEAGVAAAAANCRVLGPPVLTDEHPQAHRALDP